MAPPISLQTPDLTRLTSVALLYGNGGMGNPGALLKETEAWGSRHIPSTSCTNAGPLLKGLEDPAFGGSMTPSERFGRRQRFLWPSFKEERLGNLEALLTGTEAWESRSPPQGHGGVGLPRHSTAPSCWNPGTASEGSAGSGLRGQPRSCGLSSRLSLRTSEVPVGLLQGTEAVIP